MIRIIDFILALIGFTLLSPIFIILTLIGFFDTGSPLFVQIRLGRNQTPFRLIKFRSMSKGTPQVGTHLANSNDITSFGRFLRKTKLDELPQLINVIKGDMSLIGPRPGLPNQLTLREERKKRSVFDYRPGITGLAQVNKIDMSTPKKLSIYDAIMLRELTLCLYFQLILLTILGKGQGDRIKNNSKIK